MKQMSKEEIFDSRFKSDLMKGYKVAILAAMELYASQHQPAGLGEYQLCPKCEGTGLLNPPYQFDGTSLITGHCDVCSGDKIIQRPVLSPSQSDAVDDKLKYTRLNIGKLEVNCFDEDSEISIKVGKSSYQSLNIEEAKLLRNYLSYHINCETESNP